MTGYHDVDVLQDFMLVRLKDDPVFVQAMTEPLVDRFSLNTLQYCGHYGRIFKITGNIAEVRFDGNLKRVIALACLEPIFDDICMMEIHEDWRPGNKCILKNDPLFVHTVAERYNCGFSPPLLRFCGKTGRIERIVGPVADVRFDVRDKRRRVPIVALLPAEDDENVLLLADIKRGMHVRVKDDPLYVQAMTSASPSVPLSLGLLDWCGQVGVVQKLDSTNTRAEVRFDRNNLWMFPTACLVPVSQAPNEQGPKWDELTYNYIASVSNATQVASPQAVNYSNPVSGRGYNSSAIYSTRGASPSREPSRLGGYSKSNGPIGSGMRNGTPISRRAHSPSLSMARSASSSRPPSRTWR